eukprot:7175082-Prymnesium_polylepis.1
MCLCPLIEYCYAIPSQPVVSTVERSSRRCSSRRARPSKGYRLLGARAHLQSAHAAAPQRAACGRGPAAARLSGRL